MRKKYLPYGRQSIDEKDINEVIKVLKSDFITQGPKIKEFEKNLKDYTGSKYCVVFSSGTAALHAAYSVAGIKKDDEVITSPVTFTSTANAALFQGAKPVFTDIEEETGNIDASLIEEKITKKTKAVVPVHYSGHPVELEKIYDIAKRNNLIIIEDACHALGAEYRKNKIGSCSHSDMAIFSFHPVKSITTGEGGAVTTNNKEYYENMIMFRQHGITKDPDKMSNNEGKWFYQMQFLGYNYRITDIQCALGISQLKKIDKFIKRRREIAQVYKEKLKDNNLFDLPIEKDYVSSSRHLYPLRLKDKYVNRKKEIFSSLRESGIGVQVHYIPVYKHPYYQKIGYKNNLCPVAEKFYRKEISLPIFPSMDESDVATVIEMINKVFS